MMKLVGATLLVAGCGGFGFTLAAAHRREVKLLRHLIRAIQEMQWELKYRMTQLPELCRMGGCAGGGEVKLILTELSRRLERNEVTDISGTMNQLLSRQDLPRRVRRNLRQLGMSLGRFDLEGQLQGLEAVRRQCRQDLAALEENSGQRLRNYQTLALCAGAGLAILFV